MAVGAGQHDHAAARLETVHLNQNLVQRAVSFIVAAGAIFSPTPFAHGVNLVDEHNGRRIFAGLLEQTAHPRRANSDVYFDEIAARNEVERYIRLPSDRLS
ncbi:iron permease, putative [Babesia ovata]|uniref:Iron permease, putative n=1 Tax=Babesia ovata TaxID=189622 RepID=A0A2H6K7Y1_9APIC|nr:iron permease, putative [Babesia ovata]GBE59101.1 iron permease, putative [Babesia ovata]